jgi:putative endonuclease
MNGYVVYILASQRNGTLYTGVTSDLTKRIWEHKEEIFGGFTKEYQVKNLVYFEVHDNVDEAIKREKRLKRWNRAWKIELIEKDNPQWRDLYGELCGQYPWVPGQAGDDSFKIEENTK